eukprot:53334_1
MSSFLKSQVFTQQIKEELLLYVKLVPLIQQLDQNDLLDDIILDYHHFMLNYNEYCNQYEEIPDHIKLIWRIHLLHPYTYYNDCIKHFNHIIDPKNDIFVFNSFNINNHKQFQYKKHNNYTNKFTNIDLKQSLLNQTNIFMKNIINDINYFNDSNNMNQTIDEFIKFMKLIGMQNNTPMIPSQRVDLIWHSLMLYPKIYEKQSKLLANNFVIHDDFLPQQHIQQYWRNTQYQYNKLYPTSVKEKHNIKYTKYIKYTILCVTVAVIYYIYYNYFIDVNARRRLAEATVDTQTAVIIIAAILVVLIAICVFLYYRLWKNACQIEGCLVVLDDYEVYYHIDESFPERLKPSNPQKSEKQMYESFLLYSYAESITDYGSELLKFDAESNMHKRNWKIAFKKQDNITVGIIYSIPHKIHYYLHSIVNEFEKRVSDLCDDIVNKLPESFNIYDEDYDEDEQENKQQHINTSKTISKSISPRVLNSQTTIIKENKNENDDEYEYYYEDETGDEYEYYYEDENTNTHTHTKPPPA